ncbi:MAG: hypothetical protein JXX28_16105 [Deltaproteobacteria bacterium]|nr:hypothetical protein [Deltaproteobacteria bacterium]
MTRILPLIALLALGCNGGNDTGDTEEEDLPVFNPDDPGVHMFLTLGGLEMMGSPMELAVAGFGPAAREDFDQEAPDTTPLDSCVALVQTDPVGECAGPADCAPEQQCVPDYDDDGNPEPGSEHCETPRALMDVGPMTLEGSNAGPLQLTYNAGQDGAYTRPGTDGTLDAGTLAWDTTYNFYGDGDAAQGIGPFSGEVYLPARLQLTAPAMQDVGMGMQGVKINTAAPLTLTWTGSSALPLTIDLSGGSMGGDSGAIHCRVADDGEFTISAELVAAAHLGDMAFFNMLTLERATAGSAEADGLSIAKVDTTETLLIFAGPE